MWQACTREKQHYHPTDKVSALMIYLAAFWSNDYFLQLAGMVKYERLSTLFWNDFHFFSDTSRCLFNSSSTSSPNSVRKYFCCGWWGLSACVLSIKPASSAGAITCLMNSCLLLGEQLLASFSSGTDFFSFSKPCINDLTWTDKPKASRWTASEQFESPSFTTTLKSQ